MAKRFDQEAVATRLLQRLQVSENWSTLVAQGTIGNLLNDIAEGHAEIARYLEYLYNEKKWINARNISSTTHLTDLISYKRALPKSAIGFVIVSHTDLNGNNRLANYGSYFFELDQPSDWDNLTQNMDATATEQSALVPWTSDQSYIIPKGTVFKTSGGIPLISTETAESRSLKEPFNSIKIDETKYADFIKAGSWNGIKYVKVPVIQGSVQTVQFGRALGTRFEGFTIDSLDVENASNAVSNEFFKVFVTPTVLNNGVETDSDKTETWEQIHDIRLAGPFDKVFEKKILNDENKVLLKFGDGITGQRLPEKARISCTYLQTMGDRGNIDNKFQVTEMVFPSGYTQVDSRFNTMSNFLSCTNITPIMGGKAIEDNENIKLNAPPSYLETYAIATKASYLAQIIKNSPVNLLHCRIFQSQIFQNESFGQPEGSYNYVSSISDAGVLKEIALIKNALLITCIRANGTKLEDPEMELIDPLIKAFDDNTSPNDNFDYIEPNFIEIRPNIIVNTPETLTEKHIKDTILPEILGKYSIFSTDFEKPYYKSNIVDIVQNYSFSKYSSIFLEAKANINYIPGILYSSGNGRDNIYPQSDDAYKSLDTLLSFQFNFDKIFSSDLLKAGFKNFKQNQGYVIRADLKFRNDSTRNKTLLLLDNRFNSKDTPTIIDAEGLPIDNSKPVPREIVSPLTSLKEDLTLYNYTTEDFHNQQCRTAQFNFIDKIISDSYLQQMKKWNTDPVELTYVYTDENGRFKLFSKDEVDTTRSVDKDLYVDMQMAVHTSPNDITGSQCYWRNSQFIPNCKLMFYENYDDPKNSKYARGSLIIPLNRIFTATEAKQLWTQFEYTTDYTIMAREMELMIKNNFTLDVYAQPIMEDFECQNPYDIIFTSSSNCLIQKNFLKS
jgi:hypothetical protein